MNQSVSELVAPLNLKGGEDQKVFYKFITELEAKRLTSLFLGFNINHFDLLDYEMKEQELHIKIKKEDFISTHIFGRKSSSSPSFEEAIKPDYDMNPPEDVINKNINWYWN